METRNEILAKKSIDLNSAVETEWELFTVAEDEWVNLAGILFAPCEASDMNLYEWGGFRIIKRSADGDIALVNIYPNSTTATRFYPLKTIIDDYEMEPLLKAGDKIIAKIFIAPQGELTRFAVFLSLLGQKLILSENAASGATLVQRSCGNWVQIQPDGSEILIPQ